MTSCNFTGYEPESAGFFDEYFAEAGVPRTASGILVDFINALPEGNLQQRQQAAERAMIRDGITFTVYGDEGGTERIIPFDCIPRVIEAAEWATLEGGLQQRMLALNAFLSDVYGPGRIFDDGVIPRDLVLDNPAYRQACVGLTPPKGVWNHITGTDLIRDGKGVAHVLEDNMRCPSG